MHNIYYISVANALKNLLKTVIGYWVQRCVDCARHKELSIFGSLRNEFSAVDIIFVLHQ